jgi:hypothetical protein
MAVATLPSAAGETDVPPSCGWLRKLILRSTHHPPYRPFRCSSSSPSPSHICSASSSLLRLRRRLGALPRCLDWARGGERFIGYASACGNSRMATCQSRPRRLNRTRRTRRPRPRVQPTARPQCRRAHRLRRRVFPFRPMRNLVASPSSSRPSPTTLSSPIPSPASTATASACSTKCPGPTPPPHGPPPLRGFTRGYRPREEVCAVPADASCRRLRALRELARSPVPRSPAARGNCTLSPCGLALSPGHRLVAKDGHWSGKLLAPAGELPHRAFRTGSKGGLGKRLASSCAARPEWHQSVSVHRVSRLQRCVMNSRTEMAAGCLYCDEPASAIGVLSRMMVDGVFYA